MKIFNSISEFKPSKKTIVTLGTFDGVHIGHKQILKRLLQSSESGNAESVILTFFPHPRMVLHENSEVKLLNTIEEKAFLLEKAGLDNLIIHPFTKEFAALSAEDFVKTILVDGLHIAKIIIGHDHRFGKNRTADINDLIIFGKQFGFEVEQITAQEIDDVAVSSTKIRHALLNGNMALANEYLGYNYFLSGQVIFGKQLGRTLGFPTANIDISDTYKLIPKNGVYVVKSIIEGNIVFGLMSIGSNPTVNGKGVNIEVYYLDFDSDLYGKDLTVEVLHFIRDEQKFSSVEVLKAKIKEDVQIGIEWISKFSL